MVRLLWWVVLGLIAWAVWRSWRRGQQVAAPPPKAPPQRQLMVACARCGVHLPAQDAVVDARGQSYCCVAHRDAGSASPV